MAYFLSPIGNDQQCSANGAPLSGGKIYTYLAGSSTPAPTYTDNVTGTQQANPIILNSLGLPASPIWMQGGTPLKFIIKDSADVLIRTIDNISGINDATNAASEWSDSGLTPTYISATQFSCAGDQTLVLQVGRRVKTTNTGGTAYSTISASAYGGSITTVTLQNDSVTLDSGLSSIAYGLMGAINSSLPAIAGGATGATASVVLAKGTTAQRDTSPQAGYIRFNTSTVQPEVYNGSNWGAVGGGATGAGTDAAFYENDQIIFSSYTIGQGTLVSGVTVTIANPGVFTLSNHGYQAGQAIRFQTTGALPTGLVVGTPYYVISAGLTTSTFQVSATSGGSAVNTTGTQSGTHSIAKLKNSSTTGPLTIATGATLTVPTGSRLVVL